MQGLYIVATPIGNLADMTFRGVEVLQSVDVIFAEDTRHSKILLAHYNIKARLFSLHAHNEKQQINIVLEHLSQGQSVALISDAGTPLIQDPGHLLVCEVIKQGHSIFTVPGASALTAALSISPIQTHPFVFEGFLPAAPSQRRKHLKALVHETRSMVFYEAPHRLIASLEDMVLHFGSDREVAVFKELTKKFETCYTGSIQHCIAALSAATIRGEYVIHVAGSPLHNVQKQAIEKASDLLAELLPVLPLSQAVALTSKLTGIGKNKAYTLAQLLRS